MNPSGIRFGTPPLTTRGVNVDQIPVVLKFIDSAWKIALEIQAVSGPKLVEWKKVLENDVAFKDKIAQLRKQVVAFAVQFPLPGYDDI